MKWKECGNCAKYEKCTRPGKAEWRLCDKWEPVNKKLRKALAESRW